MYKKIDGYRYKSMMWKWDWASIVLQLLLLHLFPQVFLISPHMKNYVDLSCTGMADEKKS